MNEFSDEQKLEIINEVFEGETPKFTFYYFNPNVNVHGEFNKSVESIMSQTEAVYQGDAIGVVLAESKPGYAVRVRDPKKVPAKLQVGDLELELFKAQDLQPNMGDANWKKVDFAEKYACAKADKKDYVESQGLKFKLAQK